MSVIQKVRAQAKEAEWTSKPFRGFVCGTPSSTFEELVSTAFEDVSSTYNFARHSRLEEMYKPYLGSFRERKMYTSLAPSLCIKYGNRACHYDLAPHRSYLPKQGEWLVEKDRRHRTMKPSRNPIRSERASSEPPLPPLSRRTIQVPASNTRFQNHFLYWKGRVCGLDYISPFLQPQDYRPAEDRRYNRIYWASNWLPITPSCRHATNYMLSAY